jgi:acetoin utilization deacetylase AcuC-like enzyme
MSLHVLSSPRFADHVNPPGHPERPERNDVFEAVAARWRGRGGRCLEPRPATREELLRVHAEHYVDGVMQLAGRAVMLDPDTYTSSDTVEVAQLAAGAVCAGVEQAIAGNDQVLVLVRPPGHHAEKDKAMGFCLFNNVAIGAALARARGLSRVAVVDFDVHHGNGTQWSFYGDPAVLYVSTHQFPYYPGTGASTEIGRGEGTGYTVNVPIEAGATDADYDLVFREAVLPVLDHYAPDLLLVSAGFDAHHRDPIASMRVSTEGFAEMVAHLHGLAAHRCEGRLVVVSEGGYDLQALSDGLDVAVETLEQPARPPAPIHGDSARGRDALETVRAALKPFWPVL